MASVDLARKPMGICQLPPELLSLILREATFVLGILDPPDALQLPCRKSIDEEIFGEHCLSLDTKRHLVLVCRDWHTLATPFLYESVLIGGVKTLHGLCEGLIRPLGTSNDDNNVLTGVYVKRIDYRRPESADTVPRDHTLFSTLLNHTPNLQILDFFTENDSGSRPADMPAILNAIPLGLKAFCYSNCVYPRGPHWEQFFSTHTQLETCVVAELITGISPTTRPRFALPAVHTLIFHNRLPRTQDLAEIDLPNVRRLVFLNQISPHSLSSLIAAGGLSTLNTPFEALTPAFTILGNQLTVVEVHIGLLRDNETGTWQNMCRTIQQYCPRLERIDLAWNKVDPGPDFSSSTQTPFQFPTSVATLGVRKLMNQQPMSLDDLHYLFDRVPQWARSGGSLQKMQFTNKVDVDGIASRVKKVKVGKSVRELAQLGVVVVDDQGLPMSLPDLD